MATPKEEVDDLKSAIQALTEAVLSQADASNRAAEADKKEAAASESAAASTLKGVRRGVDGLFRVGNAAVGAVNAMYGLGKVVASIGEEGRKFAEKVGTTASKGAQFQMDINRMLLSEVKKFGADQAVVIEQIKGAYSSFADVFSGAADGMQVSAKGTADFARSLNTGFKTEFTLTAAAMKGLITVGLGTTKQFENFRKASGLAGVSTAAFTNLVNKNTLSFMLYGPQFAKAARDAERLGISLATVQKAQESLVTNLDGTIDTVAQINQLGGQVDFGTLTTLAETQGPEATLRYLQSTLPPNLFQSASTRALISKLGIPLEDLLKRQGSVQETAANQIEKAMTEQATQASRAATNLAAMNKQIKAVDNAKLMELMNAAVGVVNAFKNLVDSILDLGLAAFAASMSLYRIAFGGGKGGAAAKGGKGATAAGGAAAGASAVPKMRNTGILDQFGNPIMVPEGVTPPSPPPKAGLFSRIKSGFAGLLGDDIVRMGTSASGAVAGSSTVRGLSAGAKALGPGGAVVSAGLGGYMGFQQGKDMGFTNQEAAGLGGMRAGSAVTGGVVGGAIGSIIPGIGTAIGAAIGAVIGDTIGGYLNKNFPEMGLVISDVFKDIKTAVDPFIQSFIGPDGLGSALKKIGSIIMTVLKPVIFILGAALTGAFIVLGKVLKILLGTVGFVIDFITGAVNLAGTIIKAIWNGTLDIIKALIPGTLGDDTIEKMKIQSTNAAETPTKTGDDVVASSGYGRRTLVTPSGAIALNNRDTVIAYADDMMSGIQTYSLGTLSRRFGDGALSGEVRDLINTLRNATTNIQIDNNNIQQVPRLGLASVGVNTRSA